MDKIDEIVNDIYDPTIEDPKRQGLMASCVKAWIRDAVNRGIVLGREEFAFEIETVVKKYMNPYTKVVVWESTPILKQRKINA